MDKELGNKLHYGHMCNQLELKITVIQNTVKADLAFGIISLPSSFVIGPVLLPQKIFAWLRIDVDYWVLDLAIVRNQYSLQSLSLLYISMHDARIIKTLAMDCVCLQIWIKQWEEHHMVVQTQQAEC